MTEKKEGGKKDKRNEEKETKGGILRKGGRRGEK